MALDVEAERKRMLGLDEDASGALGDDEEVVELNVGGQHFATYKSTLCKYEGSFLEALISGRHRLVRDAAGRVFLDRPPEPFARILDWLRRGVLCCPESKVEMKSLWHELEFFGLAEFVGGEVRVPEVVVDEADELPDEHFAQLASWIVQSCRNPVSMRGTVVGEQDMHKVWFVLKWDMRTQLYRPVEVDLQGRRRTAPSSFSLKRLRSEPSLLFIAQSEDGSIFGGFNPTNRWNTQRSRNNDPGRRHEVSNPGAFLFVLHAPHHDLAPLHIPVDVDKAEYAAQGTTHDVLFQFGSSPVGGFDLSFVSPGSAGRAPRASNRIDCSWGGPVAYNNPTAFTATNGQLFFSSDTTRITHFRAYSVFLS